MRELSPEHKLEIDRVHALAFLPDGEHLLVGRYGDIVARAGRGASGSPS